MDKIKTALTEKKEIEFDVTNPRKSYAGHTVYRLQLKTYDNIEINAHYEFLGWKRFNDFRRLYKELRHAYPDIFKQHFSEFAKGKLFGRFDEAVIEERRQAALRLMMFTILYPDMIAHQAFEVFINGGSSQITPYLREAGKVLADDSSNAIEAGTEVDNEEANITDATDSGEQSVDRIQENLNECMIADESDEENDVFIAVNSDKGRESWLLEARSICGDDLESLASEAAEDFPVTPRLSSSEDTSVLLNEPLNDMSSSPLLDDITEYDSDSEVEVHNGSHSMTDNNRNTTEENFNEIRLHKKFQVDDKMSKIIERTVEEDDYVFQASVAMSNAIEQEDFGNVEAAFEMYKFGIGLLLRGVQTDDNADRREAVRRKTAQYLLRAEQLFRSSLKSSQDEQAACVGSFSGDNKWRFRLRDVKVFGIIDKVMLVQKVFSNDVFVMKVLHKQGGEYKRSLQKINKTRKQPRNLYNCHFMSRLVNCVETQTGVYLLLEHVTGGKLWDCLNMPIFPSHQRHTSCIESRHSWNATDCDKSFVENGTIHEYTDIVDVPCNNYTSQGASELASEVCLLKSTSKLKRHHSQNNNSVTEDDVRVWSAQIALALMDLHSKGVICRDLNPRNILIDCHGNIRLTYFSNVEGIEYPLDADAVTFMYTSPEVDCVFEPTQAADWWSYGAVLFELLTGQTLRSCHPDGLNSRSVITLPRRVSNEACSLLAGLLKYDDKERLGAGPSGNEEIKVIRFSRISIGTT